MKYRIEEYPPDGWGGVRVLGYANSLAEARAEVRLHLGLNALRRKGPRYWSDLSEGVLEAYHAKLGKGSMGCGGVAIVDNSHPFE